MANVAFNTVFHYSKKITNDRIKSLATKEYVELRNEVVNLLNPMYEKWNAEFGDDMSDISKYNNFIRDKQEEVIRQSGVNDRSVFVRLVSDEECDIVAVTKDTPLLKGGIKIFFTLAPIE